jgi:hypothetical protein
VMYAAGAEPAVVGGIAQMIADHGCANSTPRPVPGRISGSPANDRPFSQHHPGRANPRAGVPRGPMWRTRRLEGEAVGGHAYPEKSFDLTINLPLYEERPGPASLYSPHASNTPLSQCAASADRPS